MKNTTDKPEKHIGIRITDADLHYKLHYIARYEGRSANGQILHLIRRCIQAFEAEHGEIPMLGKTMDHSRE